MCIDHRLLFHLQNKTMLNAEHQKAFRERQKNKENYMEKERKRKKDQWSRKKCQQPKGRDRNKRLLLKNPNLAVQVDPKNVYKNKRSLGRAVRRALTAFPRCP